MILLKDRVFCPADTDEHSKMLEVLGIKDNKPQANFVKVEIRPPDGDVFAPLKEWVYAVDQDNVPDWYVQEVDEKRARVALEEWAKDHIIVGKKDFKIKMGYFYLKDCENVTISGGTVNEIKNSTINEINGGTVNEIRGGTVNVIRGGTVNEIWASEVNTICGGTVNGIWGGTVNWISGGTIKVIRGGTVNEVNGGTVNEIKGGTVKSIYGGTIKVIRGGTVIIPKGSSKTAALLFLKTPR
jgi:hypothetical protein